MLAPETVDRAMVQFALQSVGDPQAEIPDRVEAVIDGLRRSGWLLPMRTRGVWEFAPASRSGAFRSGDPFTELRAFLRRKTGVPVVLNTSFNENEPIVCQPEEAIDCFKRTRMDVLAIGPYLSVKTENQ